MRHRCSLPRTPRVHADKIPLRLMRAFAERQPPPLPCAPPLLALQSSNCSLSLSIVRQHAPKRQGVRRALQAHVTHTCNVARSNASRRKRRVFHHLVFFNCQTFLGERHGIIIAGKRRLAGACHTQGMRTESTRFAPLPRPLVVGDVVRLLPTTTTK